MDQLMHVILANDKVYTAPQRVLDYGPGLGGLKQDNGPKCPTPRMTPYGTPTSHIGSHNPPYGLQKTSHSRRLP